MMARIVTFLQTDYLLLTLIKPPAGIRLFFLTLVSPYHVSAVTLAAAMEGRKQVSQKLSDCSLFCGGQLTIAT